MKNKLNFTFTKIIFLGVMLMLGSCKDQNVTAQANSAQPKPNTPAVDIHTAVLTNNMEALKQHIAAGSISLGS